jgi:HK97 family phage portal protein
MLKPSPGSPSQLRPKLPSVRGQLSTISDRLSLALKVARGADIASVRDPRLTHLVRAIADHNSPLWPRLDVYSTQADEYSRSAWVYVAVTRIAEAAALVPFEVQRWIDGKLIAVPDHPLERLLRAPNPTMSQFELLEATFGYLELNGNAYWYLAGDEQGQPAEIWPLRPDRVRVVPDRARYVGAYVYLLDGIEIPLHADEVIHFKRWHPKDDYLGLSALEAAAMASQTDQAMAAWNYNFFDQGKAIPAGILTIKNMVSDADFERIKREWLESYGGKQRKTAFIRGSGEVGWANLGLSQQESDFVNARQMSKAEILQIFGIPAGLYDKDATYANASAARETFMNDTLWPKLIRFSQKLTQHLAPFYGDDLRVQPEDVRDNATELAEIEAAKAFLSVNEVRARYFKLPPVMWGERPAGTANTTDNLV